MNQLLQRSLLALCLTAITLTTTLAQGDLYWWNDAVFYEVFVRSYKDSDGDGKGDLRGLIDNLDYLNDGDPSTHHDLGVTALWLMPIQESPSYHGYDVTDYRAVAEDYGTNEDFQELMTEAHNRGIKVVVDYVMNHSSSQHPWFLESHDPLSDKRDWYIWQETNPGISGPWGQTVWHPRNGEFFYGIFWSGMPDLNYNTPEVQDEMFDIARFWLEEMNVDGFRLDAIKYIFEDGNTLEDTPETIQFWKDFRTYYKSVDPDAMGVGEAWTSTDKVQPYADGEGLDYCFEFDLAEAILTTANIGVVTELQAKMTEVMETYPFLQFGTFLTNHDINRVMNRLGHSEQKAKLAANILLTLPGVPYVYYGEEIGMTGTKPDPNIRTPLHWNSTEHAGFTTGTPWRTVNADYEEKNIENQQYDQESLWHHYRRLIALRNNQLALRRGDYTPVTATAPTAFTFLRSYEEEHVLVVSNAGGGLVTDVEVSLDEGTIAPGNYTWVALQGGAALPVEVNAEGGFSVTIGEMPARSTHIYKLMDPSETAVEVTFRVDMNQMIADGDFNPATESVDIVADFNGFGSTVTVLSDPEEDGIYTVTVPDRDIGSSISYKYRINGVNNGREEFSNSTFMRQYLVLEGVNTVTDTYQKYDATVITSLEAPLSYHVDVYPVPAREELFIRLSEGASGPAHYRVADLSGAQRAAGTFVADPGKPHRLSCAGLSPGIYLLTVVCGGQHKVVKVVVQ